MEPTNKMQQFINKVIPFFKQYGIFIAPLLLFLFFMFLLVFSYTRSPQKNPSNTASTVSQTPTNEASTFPSPEVSQETISSSPAPSGTTTSGEGIQDSEKNLTEWSGTGLSDSDFADLNPIKTTLSDGSIEYTYDSGVPNRPNLILLKNGVNVFQRTPFTDTTLSENTNYYGKPDYIAKGSQFWGANAVSDIYLEKGITLVGDTSKDQLYEQIIFQPTTIDQFKQEDTDMIGQPQRP